MNNLNNNGMIDRKVIILNFYEKLQLIQQQQQQQQQSLDNSNDIKNNHNINTEINNNDNKIENSDVHVHSNGSSMATELDKLVADMKEYGISIPSASAHAVLVHKKEQKLIQNKQSKKPLVRLPYRLYKSIDNIYIRVGRTATDNDVISIQQPYRNDKHWWLHINGLAGSHVVICCTDDDCPLKYKETLIDAALLAHIHSTCKTNTSTINYIRNMHVTKYITDVPGLVRLNNSSANCHHININRKKESDREKRLLESIYPLNTKEI